MGGVLGMKLFTFILRYSPGVMLLVGFISFLSGVGMTALVAVITDRLTRPDPVQALFAWQFIGLLALIFITSLGSKVLANHLLERANYDLALDLARRVSAAPLRQLEQVGADQLLTVFTHDFHQIAWMLMRVPTLLVDLATIVGSLVYLVWLSPTIALVVGGVGAPIILSYAYLHRRALRAWQAARTQRAELIGHFRALLEGIKLLKLHSGRRRVFLVELFQRTAADLRHFSVVGHTLHAVAASWAQVLYFIFIGVILIGLGRWDAVDSRLLLNYTVILLYMRGAVLSSLNMLPHIGYASISLGKVQHFNQLLAQSEPAGADGRPDLPPAPAPPSLRLQGVTYTYTPAGRLLPHTDLGKRGNRGEGPDRASAIAQSYGGTPAFTGVTGQAEDERRFTLGPLDLDIPAGQLLFITGGNGSGKSTLAYLLTGLYIPDSGALWLNGTAVTDDNREAYRQNFAAVFTDFYLFDRLLGLENPHLDQEAQAYLVRLQLDHQVTVADGRLSTLELSRGQRKRLALLTAYLENRPIYVFDEWASDQDPVFKEFFYLEILPDLRARGKTVVVISHDDRYYHVADRIVKLEDGRLMER